MRLACGGWRSSVFLVASVSVGLVRVSAADCKPSDNYPWLSQEIPSCALSCIKHIIHTEFDTRSCCHGTRSCLCRTNSTTGLTLGEAALACTYGSCSKDVISKVSSAVYSICKDVDGALPETHSTITATRAPDYTSTSNPVVISSSLTTTHTSATGSVSLTETLTTTSHSTLVTSTLVSNTQTAPPVTAFSTSTTSSLTASTVSTSTASISASATTHPSTPSLGSSAVIGIAVATGVSAIFLISVAVIMCGKRLRRRRMEAQATEGFEIGGDMSEPPGFYSPISPNPLHPFPTQRGALTPPNSGPNFHQFPTRPVNRNGPLQVIGSARDSGVGGSGFTPRTDDDESPQSQSSQHTLSQLLPDNPATQGLFPEPLAVTQHGPLPHQRQRPLSEATMIDEDDARRRSVFGPPLDRPQPRPFRVSYSERPPIGLPANPRPTIRPVGGKAQQHTLRMGGKLYKWETPDDVGLPPTPPPKSDGSIQVGRAVTRYSSSFYGPRSSSVTSNATGNIGLNRNFSRLGNGLRSMSRISRTLEEPNAPSEAGERARSIRNSNTVNTQDAENRGLGRSPVRYPTVPRSAAVSPVAERLPAPRAAHLYERRQPNGSRGSPVKGLFNIPLIIDDTSSRSRSSSPGGLLAKRRGERMAERMESQFRTGVQNTQGMSMGQTRGRPRWQVVKKESPGPVSVAGSITPGTPEDGARGRQKHNITPTRRGQDLYLSVD